MQKPTQAALLGILTIFSIGLITSTDRVASFVLPSSLETLAYIRIPSLLLCFLLWVAVGQRSAFHFPIQSIQWRRVLVPACMWLVPTAFLVLSHTVWVPYISRPLDIVAFMVTGLLAEEFLFRGAIYDLVLRVFEGQTASKVAVGYSALFFGLGHLQYHNPDSVTRCEHSAPTTIARPIRAGLGDVHDTLSCCVAECAQKVVGVSGDDDHFPRRS